MVYLIHENKKCNWGKLRDVKMNGYTNKERKGNDNRKRKEYVYGKYLNPQVWGIYFADLPKIEGSHILHGKRPVIVYSNNICNNMLHKC